VQSETDVVRLLAICVARPGLEAIVHKELLATVPVALTEPGCLEFTLHVDRETHFWAPRGCQCWPFCS
jgi:quinol monooxygenase YgiN